MKAYSYIRFSTPEQLKGDSLRRQLEAGEKYAKEHGLILDNSINLQDLGLSAFHGVHKTKGALGEFLKLVEAGMIEKGSILIVENLDRLSRENVLDALNQFTGIIKAGISIVTLQDSQKYDTESIEKNWTQLIVSITYMARANEESSTKSKRLKAVWGKKREKASEGLAKITARCPLWLRLSNDRKQYIPISEACKVVEMIYRMKLAGKGKIVITKELNQMKDIWFPPISKRNKTGGWRENYIQKILTTPAVIGIFQPQKRDEDGRKAIVCDPIPDYYPAIIDKQLYYEVQDLIKRNGEQGGKGRSGGQVRRANNLFVHLIRCGFCKHPMHYTNGGQGQSKYVHCDVSRRKLLIEDSKPEEATNEMSPNKLAKAVHADAKLHSLKNPDLNAIYQCTAKQVNYDKLERLIFDNLEELNIVDLLPDKDDTLIRLNDVVRKLNAIDPQKAELSEMINNFDYAIGRAKDQRIIDGLQIKLSNAYDKLEELDRQREHLIKEQKAINVESELMRENIDITKSVYKLLTEAKNESERIELRLRLRTELQKLIHSIEVYPVQGNYIPEREIEPGIYRVMNSKSIDKVKVRFKGSRKMRVLYLTSNKIEALNHI